MEKENIDSDNDSKLPRRCKMSFTSSRKGDCREKVQLQCVKSVQGGQICLVGTALAAALVFGGCSNATETSSTGSGEQLTEITEVQPNLPVDDTSEASDQSNTTDNTVNSHNYRTDFSQYPYSDELEVPADDPYIDQVTPDNEEQYAHDIALSLDDIKGDLALSSLNPDTFGLVGSYIEEWMNKNGYDGSISIDGNVLNITGNNGTLGLGLSSRLIDDCKEFAIRISIPSKVYIYRSSYLPTAEQANIIASDNSSNASGEDWYF